VSVSVLALLIEAISRKYPGSTSRQVGYHLVIEQIDFLGDEFVGEKLLSVVEEAKGEPLGEGQLASETQ
jgi:hypothetical protein